MENFIAISVLISSVILKCIGIPHQVRKLYKSKNSEGFSLLYYGLLDLTYLLWIFHGAYKNDWTIFTTSIIGVIATSVIVVLIIYYRPKKQKEDKSSSSSPYALHTETKHMDNKS